MLKRPLPPLASMDFEAGLGLIFPETEPKVSTERHKKISVCEPHVGEVEKFYVDEVLQSGWISSMGPAVRLFEEEFAEKIGTKFAVSCTNGTAALHLAVAALGIGPGDEVIMPTFTMIATVNAVLTVGATPVLVDCDESMNIDVKRIKAAVTDRTVAILVVHIYGVPCNMYPIMDIAKKHNLWVIEDTAESHGAEYNGMVTGSIGDIGCFSLYANKMITTGEGGIVTTNNPEIAARVRTLMNHAFSTERHFCHRLFGYNYRMTALQAALGRAQVSQWDMLIGKRMDIMKRYEKNLKGLWPIVRVPQRNARFPVVVKRVCWMFGLTVPKDIKNRVRVLLAEAGVETRNFFVPMHLQPVHYNMFEGQRFPMAESFMERGFYLPSAVNLTDDDVDYISDAIHYAVVRAKMELK